MAYKFRVGDKVKIAPFIYKFGGETGIVVLVEKKKFYPYGVQLDRGTIPFKEDDLTKVEET